ncbi:MAG TPA: DUF5979 domain-containing protein [Rhizomicrobium sp.]
MLARLARAVRRAVMSAALSAVMLGLGAGPALAQFYTALVVHKIVVDPVFGNSVSVVSGLTFTMKTPCPGILGWGNNDVLGNNQMTLLADASTPAGTACSLSEVSPASFTGNCPVPLQWSAPVYSGQSWTIPTSSGPAVNLTVTNAYFCPATPGSLVVKKVLLQDPLGLFGGTPFSIAVTCKDLLNVSTNYPLNLPNNASASINSLVPGSQCHLAEQLPILPYNCHWHGPVFSAQDVTIQSGINSVTVTNALGCLSTPGSLQIYKKVVNTLGLPTQALFPVAINCTPSGPNIPFRLIPWGIGPNPPTTGIAAASQCTVSETPPPPVTSTSACNGGSASWAATFAPAQPVTIVANQTAIVTVTNTLKCDPTGSLQIYKKVVNTLGLPTQALFPVAINCTPSGPNIPFRLIPWGIGPNLPISGIAAASQCTVSETPPPPVTSTSACGGGSASWAATFAPAQPVTIVANQTVIVTVTNTLKCATGQILVGKLYEHPVGSTFPDGAVFNFVADCRNPANPAAAHVVQTGTLTSAHSAAASLTTLSNVPIGLECTVTETVPAGVGANGCYWAPGIPVSPDPVTISAPVAGAFIAFKNIYVCAGNAAYDLGVTKVALTPPSTGGQSQGFVITVQNVGTNTLAAADLRRLVVTDNFPTGSILTSYGATDPHWRCAPPPGPLPLTGPVICTYVGGGPLGPFAALPPLQIFAIPGSGTTKFIMPGTGQLIDTKDKLNCVVIALVGTAGHDDQVPSNNSYCISM